MKQSSSYRGRLIVQFAMLIMIVTDFSTLNCMARSANNLIILLETVT